MVEAGLIAIPVLVAVGGLVAVRLRERRWRGVVAGRDIGALERMARRARRSGGRGGEETAAALGRLLAKVPPTELVELGEAALGSAHAFAPVVFEVVFAGLKARHEVEMERAARRSEWPALRAEFGGQVPEE